MTTPLADLRRLLDGAPTRGGPAIDRLPDRAVEAMAKAYLPRSIWLHNMMGPWETAAITAYTPRAARVTYTLDLTDPGTAHALLVALALYLGLDPGEGALEIGWRPIREGGWLIDVEDGHSVVWFHAGQHVDDVVQPQDFCAPTVAAEPNPVRALALAVAHVLA
jgi:hypothetical protein